VVAFRVPHHLVCLSCVQGDELTLADIGGRCLALAQDQHGSRFIQQQLETVQDCDKRGTFEELRPHFQTLMTNVFGNYVVQKFLEHGTDEEKYGVLGGECWAGVLGGMGRRDTWQRID
jgi:hypothetical protein